MDRKPAGPARAGVILAYSSVFYQMDLNCKTGILILCFSNICSIIKKQRTGDDEVIPMIDKKTTGQQLKYFMETRGFTPKDIQEYLSLSCVQTVYRWFMGVNIPNIDNLYALSSLFETSIDALVAGERLEETPEREKEAPSAAR